MRQSNIRTSYVKYEYQHAITGCLTEQSISVFPRLYLALKDDYYSLSRGQRLSLFY